MEMDLERFFRSDDMALVTYLKVEGHTPQRVAFEGGTCYWWFLITDSLLDAAQAFGAREGLVEPREYSKMFATTKSEFYSAERRG